MHVNSKIGRNVRGDVCAHVCTCVCACGGGAPTHEHPPHTHGPERPRGREIERLREKWPASSYVFLHD